MLIFKNVTKIYYPANNEPVFALNNVSFKINQGEFVLLVGKSGAGKTTIINLISVQEKPNEGKIFYKNIDLTALNRNDIQKIRRSIGVVHQDCRLLNNKTVWENLSYIMEMIGLSDSNIKRDIPQVLELVDLLDRANHFPAELSGGERQRLAIARALVHRPDLLMADEPTGNLDLYNTFEIINLFKKIHSLGTTIILSTHDRDIVGFLKTRAITLDEGKIINDDPSGKFIL